MLIPCDVLWATCDGRLISSDVIIWDKCSGRLSPLYANGISVVDG